MTRPRTITIEQLRDELAAGSIRHFWNVLTDDYFTGESIPGSVRVPLDRVGRHVAQREIRRDERIVTYCSGPGCPQSVAAAEKLVALGFTDVRAFEGGLAAWKELGLPVERLETTAAAS